MQFFLVGTSRPPWPSWSVLGLWCVLGPPPRAQSAASLSRSTCSPSGPLGDFYCNTRLTECPPTCSHRVVEMGRVSGVILVLWDARGVLYCRYFIDGWLFGGREVFVWVVRGSHRCAD